MIQQKVTQKKRKINKRKGISTYYEAKIMFSPEFGGKASETAKQNLLLKADQYTNTITINNITSNVARNGHFSNILLYHPNPFC